MKFISTKTHGFLDYITGIVLILSPWLFDFDTNGPAQWVPVFIGILILVMALFTNFEAGVVKRIPMSFHLTVDVIAGIFLAVSPWLFGFDEIVYLPHLLVGIFIVFNGLFTQRSHEFAHA